MISLASLAGLEIADESTLTLASTFLTTSSTIPSSWNVDGVSSRIVLMTMLTSIVGGVGAAKKVLNNQLRFTCVLSTVLDYRSDRLGFGLRQTCDHLANSVVVRFCPLARYRTRQRELTISSFSKRLLDQFDDSRLSWPANVLSGRCANRSKSGSD